MVLQRSFAERNSIADMEQIMKQLDDGKSHEEIDVTIR